MCLFLILRFRECSVSEACPVLSCPSILFLPHLSFLFLFLLSCLQSGFWGLIFIALGGAQFLCEGLKFFSIEFLGLKLVSLLRGNAFTQTLHQEMAFFDKQENNVGKPSTTTSTNCMHLLLQSSASRAPHASTSFCPDTLIHRH